jgi:hypothetical protein
MKTNMKNKVKIVEEVKETEMNIPVNYIYYILNYKGYGPNG